MVRGKKADKVVKELEEKKKAKIEEVNDVDSGLIEEPVEEQDVEEEESEGFRKVLSEFKEDGGWVHIKKKKDGKIVKIGKYRPNDFDKDEIAKEYGGGTYYYDLRDNNGRIRAKSEETYIEKQEPEKPQNNEMLQMAMLIKEQTKEIETLKAEILKPKTEDVTQNAMLQMVRDNQKQMIDLFTAVSKASQPVQQPVTSMTEMLTAITTIMTLINKQQPQVHQEQPKNNISDLVELAGLFADMKNSGEPPKQETMIDIIKTFLTDGSLANVIAMLKQPKPPIIQNPNKPQQLQQPQQQQQNQQIQEQLSNEKSVVQEFFKQYEKQLFQLKVNGGTAEYIANTIIPFFDLNAEFKTIGYNYFKDIDTAYNGLMEVAVEFKNEQELLRQVVETIHNYFEYDTAEGETENGQE